MGWLEVADGVFFRRYQPWDVNVGVVVGSAGVLVIDTRANEAEGAELRRDLRARDPRPPRWVVNTHSHFDHVGGNGCFPEARVLDWSTAPDEAAIDLGDRSVGLLRPGRGHTGEDIVVSVPGVVFAGDLVEESGPPGFDELSYPLDWPVTNGWLVDVIGERDVVVPGHGAAVDRRFVANQQRQLDGVARTIRDLWAAGVPEEAALEAGGERWPFPPAGLADAVRRGYRQLR